VNHATGTENGCGNTFRRRKTICQAGRTWRVVKACIAHFVNDAQDNWCQYSPFVRLASNAAWHRSINTSPAKVFLGRELRLPVDLLLPRDANQLPECESVDDFASQLTSLIKQVWEEARKYGYLSAQEQKRYFDAKGVHVNLKVGDRVYKHTPRGQLGKATKLLHHYEGPFGWPSWRFLVLCILVCAGPVVSFEGVLSCHTLPMVPSVRYGCSCLR